MKTINLKIGWNEISDDKKQGDLKIICAAEKKTFGSSNVKTMVDNLVKRGYTDLYVIEGSKNKALLRDENGIPFLIDGKEEFEYIQMLLRRLNF